VNFNFFFISGQPMGKQQTLDQMLAGIPSAQSVINFFMNAISTCQSFSQMFELCHTFKDLLPTSILLIGPAVYTQDMIIYLVFSAFTYKPVSILVTNKTSVFFYSMHVLTS
jgi:hypothetical protein